MSGPPADGSVSNAVRPDAMLSHVPAETPRQERANGQVVMSRPSCTHVCIAKFQNIIVDRRRMRAELYIESFLHVWFAMTTPDGSVVHEPLANLWNIWRDDLNYTRSCDL